MRSFGRPPGELRRARFPLGVGFAIATGLLSAVLIANAGAGDVDGSTSSVTVHSVSRAGLIVDGAADAPDDSAGVEKPAVQTLNRTAERIRSLLEASLDVGTEPPTLFEVDLGDEPAIRVEVERLRAVVGYAPAARANETAQKPRGKPLTSSARSQTQSVGPGDANIVDAGSLAELEPDLWRARLNLDRARLDFLSLPKPRRDALLAEHSSRQQIAAEGAKHRPLDDAQRKTLLAETERKIAVDAAQRARSEAERTVAEEVARLLGVKKRQAEYEAELVARDVAIAEQDERFLNLVRRVRDARLQASADSTIAPADDLYEEVRALLRTARARLLDAASAVGSTHVPRPADTLLEGLPAEVDRSRLDEVRRDVHHMASVLEQREIRCGSDLASVLYKQVVHLNQERLALLPLVSEQKRNSITGFGPVGLDQATAEARQVGVVLHYHAMLGRRWIVSMRNGADRAGPALDVSWVTFKVLAAIAVFAWWRRRAARTLETLRDATRGAGERLGTAPPTPAEHLVTLLIRTRSPLEWLLLLGVLMYLLPAGAGALLEVQLANTVMAWAFGGSLVVQVVDFLAGQRRERITMRRSRMLVGHIRLRSLKLMGRVVVVVGLVLAISDRLVGRGTIYEWLLSLCWLAAIPVALVLLHWWREVILERIALRRRKSRLKDFIIGNSNGWRSYPAVALGGVLLIFERASHIIRAPISRLDLTRRVIAYLFRREISKRTGVSDPMVLQPLDSSRHALLDPDTPSSTLVPSVADADVDEVIGCIRRSGGGIFAIVGERGSGKTTVIGRIGREVPEARYVQCPFGGIDGLAASMFHALGTKDDTTLEDVLSRLDRKDGDRCILLDDAHRLVRPTMGGLASFDRMLAIARRHSEKLSWVLAVDDVIWRFLERMRDTQPTFDKVIRLKPWNLEAIELLLKDRSKAAGAVASFSHLVGQLAADADEVDREEETARTAARFYRLIWDHASGNPGAALHAWRSALGTDADGAVHVRAYQAPPLEELERLPDQAAFVLRAIMQLERGTADEIGHAVGVAAPEVESVLRFGLGRGYFRKSEEGYGVTWHWFRTITRFLQRHHLLSAN